MKKNCLCCGKTTSHLDMPIDLADGQILCRDCVGDIVYDINKIYQKMTEEDFKQLKNKIIADCETRFNQDMIEVIIATIDAKYYGTTTKIKISTTNNNFKKINTSNTNYTSNENSSMMFDNIGGKIKTLAEVVTWIGIIASVISGIAIMSIGEEMIFVGLMVMIFGALISWVSSFVLYGFGQLVENSDKLVKMSKK